MRSVTPPPPHRRVQDTAFGQVLETVAASRLGAAVPPQWRDRARDNAIALLEAAGGTGEALTLATVAYAAGLLGTIAVDLAAHPDEARRLVDDLQARAGVHRVALGRELLRAGRLLELTASTAVEVTLALLAALTDDVTVTLWSADEAGAPRLTAGHRDPGTSVPEIVTAALSDETRRPLLRDGAMALRIDALRPPPAALLAVGVGAAAPETEPMLAAAGPLLAAALERRSLRERERSGDSLRGAVQRRLARLRYDLHDGPQQDIHLLAQDLQLFREQLRPMIAGEPDEQRVIGRLDDLEAQLVALDGDLRRLSTSVQSPFLTTDSLQQALLGLAEAFAQRSGITPRTDVAADLGSPTDSQQITLLALVREALSNIGKHSGAATVSISVQAEPAGLRVQITDDGTGFDPEATLVRAARAGRLGLVGMHERVRMLGGHTQIESRPGGPTTISALLPSWPETAS